MESPKRKVGIWCRLTVISPQGSASAVKGDFLLSSEHLIETITKLHHIGSTASDDGVRLNIDITDEYVSSVSFNTLLTDKVQLSRNYWRP